jgi:hypothetical protein
VVSNRRDDAAIRRFGAAVGRILQEARLGGVVASICCRYHGQIVFYALEKSSDSPM